MKTPISVVGEITELNIVEVSHVCMLVVRD